MIDPASPGLATAPGAPARSWPRGLHGLAYGADYNPEQWPEEVWREDVALMRAAGRHHGQRRDLLLGALEPAAGQYRFDWLDRLLDLLHANGIRVDLGTPTVVPPNWFYRAHPEALPITRDGVRLGPGSRAAICHSSPAYLAAAGNITAQLALRYADHPALAMWHVHNEYGTPVSACYCEISGAAFRDWLQARYTDLDILNEAWGTTFWGQFYGDWAEIQPPRLTPTACNPAQQLDYARFTSDAILASYRTERDILHRLSPGIPVTTNFQNALTQCESLDYWAWASEVDLVTNDHYLIAERDRNHVNLAMTADITRSLAGGQPWLLLEHSTSAVNWQPRNLAKRPGEMARNSLGHVARGSDGAMFFQWRASRIGAEKFHSAMLPHAGTDSRVWREVVALGADLGRLAEIQGSRVVSDVAMLWDWQSWWAQKLEWRPSVDLDARERAEAYYQALYDRHLTVDFAHPTADLSAYRLVVVPALYLITDAAVANLRRYVEAGGTVLVSYFSGIVDANDAVHPGPHPGPLGDVLGLRVEEWLPLRHDEAVPVHGLDAPVSGAVWAEAISPRGAQTVASYAGGPADGGPAILRNALGDGHAWYVSTRLSAADLDRVLVRTCADAGLPPRDDLPRDVELVRRAGAGVEYLFAINHTDQDVKVVLETAGGDPASSGGVELITGESTGGSVAVPAGAVRVVRLAG